MRSTTFQVFDDTRGQAMCRSCAMPITWFVMVKSGKRMPFDGDPVYVRTELDPETRRLIGHIDGSMFGSHFATCKDANDWRRR